MLDFKELKVSNGIKSVLNKYHIDFVFQPIFDRNDNIYAHEALMRPENMSILDLIEKAKEDNTLHELELLTFFGAFLAFQKRGYRENININSFPSECLSREEFDDFCTCFKQENVDERLIIEILEHVDCDEDLWKAKSEFVQKYQNVQIAIDDFGTGSNSSVDVINRYQPRIVKIDRSLIQDIDKFPTKQATYESLLTFFHDNNIQVLAEGIETKEEYEYLYQINTDFFQGYYLQRPI